MRQPSDLILTPELAMSDIAEIVANCARHSAVVRPKSMDTEPICGQFVNEVPLDLCHPDVGAIGIGVVLWC
jgi:hypothetical protein